MRVRKRRRRGRVRRRDPACHGRAGGRAFPRPSAFASASGSTPAISSSRGRRPLRRWREHRRPARADSPSRAASASRVRSGRSSGQIGCRFEDLGERRLKNIERPVRAYRFARGAGTGACREPAAHSAHDKPSVAVLPFANLSGDPAQAYFSDGISEDIITELSRFRDLLVIARNSSFAFREQAGRSRARSVDGWACVSCSRAACARRASASGSRPS